MPIYQATQHNQQMMVAIDVGQWLQDTAAGMAGNVGQSLVTPLLGLIEQAGISTTLTFHIPILQLPQGNDTTLDPAMVLDNIAQAVTVAEQGLNQQNMLITAGNIETSLTIDQGNGQVAQSKISLSISPKSYL